MGKSVRRPTLHKKLEISIREKLLKNLLEYLNGILSFQIEILAGIRVRLKFCRNNAQIKSGKELNFFVIDHKYLVDPVIL